MIKKDNKPEIRFKGFDDSWEECDLGKLSESFEYGLNASAMRYDGIHKYIRITDIDDESHSFIKNALTSPNVDFRFVDRYKLNEGDLLFARTGASVGKTYNYREDDGLVYYAGFLIRARIKDEFNSEFVFQNTLTNAYVQFIKLTSQRSGQPGVNAQEYSEYRTNIPKRLEQNKIAKFLGSLDNLIVLNQRKHDKLIKVKKSMLEKMFPKEGADVPEIRFAGFADPWVSYELGDVTKRIKGNDGRMDIPTLTISAGRGWLDQRERFYGNIAGKEQVNYTLLSRGELSYNHGNSKFAKYGAVYSLETCNEALVPKVYHSFKVNERAVAGFIEYLFATKIPDNELRKIISSGARMDGLLNISYDDFSRIKIIIPDAMEQKKISIYFRTLDNLISLQKQELEKLKNIKKACLEKMFV